MMLSFDTNIFPYKKGVYIVGGSIRDLMRDRKPLDYDVVVQGDPAFFAKRLAAKTSGRLVELGKPGQTMRRVVTEDLLFDVMPLNGATIEEDLLQRDFTINAMAVAVSSGHLIDKLGGRQDLASKKIRMVSVDAFRKDPVRLVRAYRLAAVFDLSMDAGTHRVLARDAHLISRSAGERVREEFFKIFQCAASHACLAGMAHSGLLFNVFPELLALKNYRLPGAHPHNLFEQTIDSCHGLEKLLAAGDWLDKVSGDRVFQDKEVRRVYPDAHPGLLFGFTAPVFVAATVDRQRLIDVFGLKPSAHFKRILERVDEERLTKPALTRQQALKLVEELIRRRNRTL